MNEKNRIYIGNLSFSTTADELREKFSQYGKIEEVALIMDRATGRPKGFGFVTYSNNDEAQAAIQSTNDQEFGGRKLRVNLANPKEADGGGRRPTGPRRSFHHDRDARIED